MSSCTCCSAPQNDWKDLKTEGSIRFYFPFLNPISIKTIIENWIKKIKFTSSYPESLICLILNFITLENFGNTFKVPETIHNGRYTKVNITKNSLTANVLQKSLGMCSFQEFLKGTTPFPENKISHMSVIYNHDLPTLDMKQIQNFGNNGPSPTRCMVVIAVIGIRDIDEDKKETKPAEYMIINKKHKSPKDTCIRKAFKVLDTKNKTIKTQIICNFANKDEKTVTFIVNGRKLIPKINKNKNYSLKIRKEHQNIKFVPFIYCRLFMQIHFPQWKYGRAFPQAPPSPNSEDLEEEETLQEIN